MPGSALLDKPRTRGSLGGDLVSPDLFSPPVGVFAKLIEGDSTQPHVIADETADLIVTSPPYNLGKAYTGNSEDDALSYEDYAEFSRSWLENCYRWSQHTGRLCVNVGLDKNKFGKRPLSADMTRWAMEAGWNYHATIVWNEGNISRRTAWGSWMSASAPHVIAPVEVIIILHKGDWKRERQGESDTTAEEFKEWVFGVWDFNGESGKRVGHEAPFPRELPKRCIKLFSFVGDTVLDPFCGSGTTMIEAINLGRNSVGIELEPQYCLTTIERVEKECEAKLKKSQPGRAAKYIKGCWEL